MWWQECDQTNWKSLENECILFAAIHSVKVEAVISIYAQVVQHHVISNHWRFRANFSVTLKR